MAIRNLNKILNPELSYKIYGACFGAHNKFGQFRSEKSYADALEQKFIEDNIKYVREVALKPSFDGENKNRNIPDFVVEDLIILDVKAKRIITKEDYYQMKRYLEAADKELGLIVNFRQKYLSPKRVLCKKA